MPNKIQEINEKIYNLNLKSTDITSNIDNKRLKNEDIDYKPNINYEYSILKSDNIIFREEINKLGEMNNHYEDELQKHRNKT